MRRARGAVGMAMALCIAASAVSALWALPTFAQGGTDVWIVPLTERGSSVTVGRPTNLTKRPGYDNQPAFTPDGAHVMFTSIREDAQADIWRVGVNGTAPTPLTETPESEYSATPLPDGSGFSVIRVEMDSTQRLWAFDWNGTARAPILPALKPVGYHVWVSDHALGAFVLGSPAVLAFADTRTARVDTITNGIGRAFARVPGRDAFTFVRMRAQRELVELDIRTQGLKQIAVLPEGAEYHVFTGEGRVITSSGSRLFILVDDRWDVLADLGAFGVRGISRLALNARGDQLAFVADEARDP